MTPISFLRQLYSLDALDARFSAASSRTPPKHDDNETRKNERSDRQVSTEDNGPSRWNTTEFYFYGVVFLVCVPQMYWAVVQVSQRKIIYMLVGGVG